MSQFGGASLGGGAGRSLSRRRGIIPRGVPRLGVALAALIAIVFVGAIAYAYFTSEATGGEARAACMLVIDQTQSVSHESVLDKYHDAARQVVRGCDELDAELAIGHFDLARAKLDYVDGQDGGTTFSLYPPLDDNDQRQERDERDAVQAAMDAVDDLFDQQPDSEAVRGSDILTPLATAAHDLSAMSSLVGASEKYLVLLTDGQQLGESVNVNVFTSPDVAVDPLVETARGLGLIPPLEGVQTSVVGVRGSLGPDDGGLDDWFEAKLAEFWNDVITEGGGRVCEMSIDSLVFPGRC